MNTPNTQAQFDFGEDLNLAGFRLSRVEVYNWGTFHDKIWSLELKGRNALLTGDVGSGKSTLVDAITTLLIPAHKAAYNKAAGAQNKERTLSSYVQGFYKSSRNEVGGGAKPVALRSKNTFSVILGVFENKSFAQTLTLAQVFWMKESHSSPERFFAVADCDLNIKDDFSSFGKNIANLKKKLKGREQVEVFESFNRYASAFQRRLGLQSSQALELFHQTVSMKSVGNLTEFVREHMLEAFPIEEKIEELIRHFDDLNRAHDLVKKAQSQIEHLSPLVENLNKTDQLREEIEWAKELRDELGAYFSAITIELLEIRKKKFEKEFEKLANQGEIFREKKSVFYKDRDELTVQIGENGGTRLESLVAQLKELELEKKKRIQNAEDYKRKARIIGLERPLSADVFQENFQLIREMSKRLEGERQNIQNDLVQIGVSIRQQKDVCESLSNEISSLKSRKNNIPVHQEKMRSDLCRALNLNDSEIPFAGELIRVDENSAEWEGAVERVLHSFSLSLLVSEKYYEDVTQWVERTNLKGRLVYFKTSDFSSNKSHRLSYSEEVHRDSLVNKLKIKGDSDFYEWLENELTKRFNYVCCDDLSRFRKEKKALTLMGQVKSPGGRHEKDDRHNLKDRSRYVLGWSNEAKISTLQAELQKEEEQGHKLLKQSEVLQKRNAAVQEQLIMAGQMETYRSYRELDFAEISIRIQTLDEERLVLENSSDLLKDLQKRKLELENQVEKLEQEITQNSREQARLEEKLDALKGQIEERELDVGVLSFSEAKEKGFQLYIDQVLSGKKISVESSRKDEQNVRLEIQRVIDNTERKRSHLNERIVSSMQKYRNLYPAETLEADAAVEAGGEYRTMLDKLLSDDLPRFRNKFKDLLNTESIRGLSQFSNQLNRQQKQIQERVEVINTSLAGIEYNPGRYIALEASLMNDGEIQRFKQDLRACMEGALSVDKDEGLAEQKFLEVKSIVDRFRGREGLVDLDKRWTRKVTDVRNWFEFAASERFQEDDSEYEHYTSSGGKSGGQKEKLAYTVLAASLAYQFGLEWEETRSRSFRFVVIDEAFGRGSDESARFGLELFKKLNLQLLIVTPLQKIHVIEPYVRSVGFVSSPEQVESTLRTLSIEQYREEREKVQLQALGQFNKKVQ
jgi:uncharacterized protein YPO0396